MMHRHLPPLHAWLSIAALSSLGSWAAVAQEAAPPNPAAEQAVRTHANNLLAAINGQAAAPTAQQFTEDFNRQVQPEQVSTVLRNVSSSVGQCQISAQMRTPISHAAGYLLACDKAYVPMELMVENNAPFRIQALLLRPSFWKN